MNTSEKLIQDDEGSVVEKYIGWLKTEEADHLFELLTNHVKDLMDHDRGKLFGKEWTSKRLVVTIGENSNISYTYSGMTRKTNQVKLSDLPWLNDMRHRLELLCGHELNFAFINFYRPSTNDHPDDQLGFHSDDEKDMTSNAPIVSLSVGDTRHFAFRKKGKTTIHCQTPLRHGDVAIMRGTTQQYYEHAITAKECKKSTKGRFNITFRHFPSEPATKKIKMTE